MVNLEGPVYRILAHNGDMVRQRSQRRDPDQEAILRGKDELNTRTTDVIKRLIDVKRQWNGNTEPKFRLTDPMPDEIVNDGMEIIRDLSDIMNGLRQVDQMQDEYAERREQRVSERMKQLDQMHMQAAAAVKDRLTKEASSRLSRLWSHIISPFSSERGKKDRLRMLRALARIDYNLRDVEDKVLSGDPAILDALYLARQMWLDAKGSFFEDYRKNLKELSESASVEYSRLVEELENLGIAPPEGEEPQDPGALNEGEVQVPDSKGEKRKGKGNRKEKSKKVDVRELEENITNQNQEAEEEAKEALNDRLKEVVQVPPESELALHGIGTPTKEEVDRKVSKDEQERLEKERRMVANLAVLRRRNMMSVEDLLKLYLDEKTEAGRRAFMQTLTEDNRDALNEEIDRRDIAEDEFEEVEEIEYEEDEPVAPISAPQILREVSSISYDKKVKIFEEMLDYDVPEEAIQALNLHSEGYNLTDIAYEVNVTEEGEEPTRDELARVARMIEIAQRNFLHILDEMELSEREAQDKAQEEIEEAAEEDETAEEDDDFDSEEYDETAEEDDEFEEYEEEIKVQQLPKIKPVEKQTQAPVEEPIAPVEETVGVIDPEPEPSVPDPVERQRALRVFIRDNIEYWYSDTKDYIQTLSEVPEPWNNRMRNQWTALNSRIERLRQSKGDAEWTKNYLLFLKAVGDIRATINQTQVELDAKDRKPDFEFGVTMNDGQLENHARTFVKKYQEDLEKFIDQNYRGLISQASNPISRWLKRMQTNLGWSRDKSIRLMVDRHIREARQNLQAMMDNLEKRNINFRSLIRDSEEFYDSFIQVYDKLADLADAYNSRMRIEKSDRKQTKSRMPYEIIPNSDIYSMRTISRVLNSDRIAINHLNTIEQKISAIQNMIDEAKQGQVQNA